MMWPHKIKYKALFIGDTSHAVKLDYDNVGEFRTTHAIQFVVGQQIYSWYLL